MMISAISFILALDRLLLIAILVWGLIQFLPIESWLKHVAEVLLLMLVIFSLLADVTAAPRSPVDLPYPLNPSSPENPSRVK